MKRILCTLLILNIFFTFNKALACDQTSITVLSSYNPPSTSDYIYTVEVCLGISPNWGETGSFSIVPDANVTNLTTTTLTGSYNYCTATLAFNGQGCAVSAMGFGPAGGTVQTATVSGSGSIGGGGSQINFTTGGGSDPFAPDDLVGDCADCNNGSQVCYTVTFTTDAPITTMQLTNAEGGGTTCPDEIILPPVPPTCTPATTTAVASPISVCEGDAIDLSSTCSGCGGSTTYSWSGPGGYNSSTNDPAPFVASQNSGGTYSFSADNAPCSSVPSTIAVAVTPKPRATLGVESIKNCVSNDIPISFTGTAPYSITYLIDGVPTTVSGINVNPYSINVPTNSTVTLQANSVSDGAGCGAGFTSGTTQSLITQVNSDAGSDFISSFGVSTTIDATATAGLTKDDTTITLNPLSNTNGAAIPDAGTYSATDITLSGVTDNCPMDLNNIPSDDSGICFEYSHLKAGSELSLSICYPSGSSNCLDIAEGSLPNSSKVSLGMGAFSIDTIQYCVPFGDLITLFDGQTCGLALGLDISDGNAGGGSASGSFVGWSTNIQDFLTTPIPNPTYNWSAFNGSANTSQLSCTDCEDPVFTAPGSVSVGCFILTVTDAFGCEDLDTVCYDVILDLENLNFEAEVLENKVLLKWLYNNSEDKYIIERSVDGIEFKNISNEIINSENKNEFTFIDEKPIEKAYYRLKAITKNGEIKYSDSKLVELNKSSKFYINKMYPNPFRDRFNVELYLGKEDVVEFILLDITGKQILKEKFTLFHGLNSINLDLETIKNGNYLLSIVGKENVIKSKIIKE